MHKVFLWNLDISLLWVEHRAGHAFCACPWSETTRFKSIIDREHREAPEHGGRAH
jgi:hypothetical protein